MAIINTNTQEDKQLLLLDLCARLPYEVKGKVYAEVTNGKYDMNGEMIFYNAPFDVTLDSINTSTGEIHVVAIGNEDTVDFIEDQQTCGDPYTIDDFKPYLRPMSSMTEEEKQEMHRLLSPTGTATYQNTGIATPVSHFGDFIPYEYMARVLEWLNAHHFDYRNLIEKGLALEAPEGTYK